MVSWPFKETTKTLLTVYLTYLSRQRRHRSLNKPGWNFSRQKSMPGSFQSPGMYVRLWNRKRTPHGTGVHKYACLWARRTRVYPSRADYQYVMYGPFISTCVGCHGKTIRSILRYSLATCQGKTSELKTPRTDRSVTSWSSSSIIVPRLPL